MVKKTCTKCLVEKEIIDFHSYFSKNLGRIRIKSICKICSNADSRIRVKAYYQSDRFKEYKKTDKYKNMRRAIHAKHRKNPVRIEWTKKYQRSEKQKEYRRKRYRSHYVPWMKTPKAIENRKKYRISLKKRFPEKIRARDMIQKHIKRGLIIRPNVCSNCNQEKFAEAHHHVGYSKENWLNVKWLCKKCHIESHQYLKLNPLLC